MVENLYSAVSPPPGALMNISSKLELGKMGTQKNNPSDQEQGFVVDIDSLFHNIDEDITANSRITLQKSYSRKIFQHEENKNTCQGDTVLGTVGDGDGGGGGGCAASGGVASSGGGGPGTDGGSDGLLKVNIEELGKTEQIIGSEKSKQMIITSNCSKTLIKFKRTNRNRPWIGPRRIFLFFATLSSMGTILLIYFTLSMGKVGRNDNIFLE